MNSKMIKRGIVYLGVLVNFGMLVHVLVETRYSNSQVELFEEVDNVCGPRCVDFILKYFGMSTPEFFDLVQEIQKGDLENGASLKDLADGLERRGMYSYMVKFNRRISVSWPYPVILHTKTHRGCTGRCTGHYIVKMPDSLEGGSTKIWAGLDGYKRVDNELLNEFMTGHLLLVAPEPQQNIDLSKTIIALPRNHIILPSIMVASVASLVFWQFHRLRGLSISTFRKVSGIDVPSSAQINR